MASPAMFTCIAIFLICCLCNATAHSVSLPVFKDEATLQFYTTVSLGTPPAALPLVIDLGGQTLWINCDNYNSSTFRPLHCGTSRCNAIGDGGCILCTGTVRPDCTNNTCRTTSSNPFTGSLLFSGTILDQLLVGSRNNVRGFPFTCSLPGFIDGLFDKAQGMFGLGSAPMAPPAQLSSSFKIPNAFALCLPSSSRSAGSLLFGDLSSSKYSPKSLSTTPIIDYPVAETVPAEEYYIGVTSIRVNAVPVKFDSGLLAINSNRVGGTKISTAANYTVLHTKIYNPLVRAFEKAASNIKMKKVASVGGFEKCYSSKSVGSIATGPAVPTIDLVLQSKDVYWRIYGANSMVKVNNDVLCLGFVDAGERRGQLVLPSVVVGTHQVQDNLLVFDLKDKILKFSSSLLQHNSKC